MTAHRIVRRGSIVKGWGGGGGEWRGRRKKKNFVVVIITGIEVFEPPKKKTFVKASFSRQNDSGPAFAHRNKSTFCNFNAVQLLPSQCVEGVRRQRFSRRCPKTSLLLQGGWEALKYISSDGQCKG
jgi:hypothetical protein